jgi:hypothetical protein
MAKRYADFTEIIGTAGRGKTTQLLNILNYKVQKKGERCLVVIPDGSEKAWFDYPTIFSDDLETDFDINFEGILCIEYEENLTFPFLYKKFKHDGLANLNLVLDDPFYAEGRPEKEIRMILARKRQWAIDIFSNSHSYDQVPPIFFPYITIFGLGYTEAEIVNRRKQLGEHFDIHCRMRNAVNKFAGLDKSKPEYYNFVYFLKNGEIIGR